MLGIQGLYGFWRIVTASLFGKDLHFSLSPNVKMSSRRCSVGPEVELELEVFLGI